jgi:hypothetical protein
MATKQKQHTSLVHNTGRVLTIKTSGGKTKMAATPNKRRKRRNTSSVAKSATGATVNSKRRRSRRRNSAATGMRRAAPKTVNARRRGGRRRGNPSQVTSLFSAAAFTAVGVNLFDTGLNMLLPPGNPLFRVGAKLGGAYVIATHGRKLPIIGKHADTIALVVAVLGLNDLWVTYLAPRFGSIVPSFLQPGGGQYFAPAPQLQQIAAPQVTEDTISAEEAAMLGDVYEISPDNFGDVYDVS